MVADAGGDDFEGGAQGRDVGGQAGEGSGVCEALAVVLDEGAQWRVSVEGGAAEAAARGDLGEGVVESTWGAVSGLLPVRFPRSLAEPAVRISPQRALHGFCRQA